MHEARYLKQVFALDRIQELDPAGEERFLAAVPSQPAVFLIEMHGSAETGARPYLARTANLQQALDGDRASRDC